MNSFPTHVDILPPLQICYVILSLYNLAPVQKKCVSTRTVILWHSDEPVGNSASPFNVPGARDALVYLSTALMHDFASNNLLQLDHVCIFRATALKVKLRWMLFRTNLGKSFHNSIGKRLYLGDCVNASMAYDIIKIREAMASLHQ